jgi:hypothetical protein
MSQKEIKIFLSKTYLFGIVEGVDSKQGFGEI